MISDGTKLTFSGALNRDCNCRGGGGVNFAQSGAKKRNGKSAGQASLHFHSRK